MLKTCTKCGIEKELSEFHKTNHNKIGRQPKCIECTAAYAKKWREKNKESILEYSKEWRKNNKEQQLKVNKEWRENNKEKKRKINKLWIKNNPKKYAEKNRRHTTKRKRNLGYNPLNEKTSGSVGHHINKNDVIYIPEEIHKSIPHSQDNPISMGEINILALEYLL